MAIITISRGSYSKGKRIAEEVARVLKYRCVSRDVLLEASEQFNVPELKLVRALHDAPSLLDRISSSREKYVAFVQRAFLEAVHGDDVVYHGLAGHFFVQGVSHVLKVRIIADLEDRVRLEMEREQISESQARRVLKKDDHERRKWSVALYGIDPRNAALYDLVIHIRRMTVADAVEVICGTARLPQFRSTEGSRQALDDLLQAARERDMFVWDWSAAAGSRLTPVGN